MVKVRVSKVEWSPTYGSDTIVLKEMTGRRYCSLVIKEWEAQAIGILLDQRSQEPYKTAWLLSYLLEDSHIKILRVEIKKTMLGEIVADIIYCTQSKTKSITHSIGEAIELALRCRVSIMIKESLLNALVPAEASAGRRRDELEALKARLQKAVESEQYEKAAALRDRILKIEKRRNPK